MIDLAAYEQPPRELHAGDSPVPERVREFYKANIDEVLARMRKPTTPTRNLAAEVVLQCETNPRLRSEAERALEIARRAGEARSALDDAIAAYESPNHT